MSDAPASTDSLILHPEDAGFVPPDLDALVAELRRLGLIDGPIDGDGPGHFLVGQRFLNLVTFLGCSPAVALGPADDPDSRHGFCRVRFVGPFAVPRLRYGESAPAPRCPRCRAPVQDWARHADAVADTRSDPPWSCPECGAALAPAGLDWRRAGGVARLFIDIQGIYPHEAVPGDPLLGALRAATGVAWGYFCARV